MQGRRAAGRWNAGFLSDCAGYERPARAGSLPPAGRQRCWQAFEDWIVATAMAQSSLDVAQCREWYAIRRTPVKVILAGRLREARNGPVAGCAGAGNG